MIIRKICSRLFDPSQLQAKKNTFFKNDEVEWAEFHRYHYLVDNNRRDIIPSQLVLPYPLDLISSLSEEHHQTPFFTKDISMKVHRVFDSRFRRTRNVNVAQLIVQDVSPTSFRRILTEFRNSLREQAETASRQSANLVQQNMMNWSPH
jgi:hypothetical protein